MRNFEEIKAEVFRRSENRIKERKRNSLRALIVCVPLCLMLTFLPSILPESDKNLSTGGTDVYGDANTGINLYVEVETLGASDFLQSQLSALDVTQFYYTLESAFVSQDEMEIKPGAQEDNLSHKESTPLREFSSFSSGYKIIFKTEKNTQAIYILNGYTLTNDTTKQKITLSEEQRSQILNELGLVLTWEEP